MSVILIIQFATFILNLLLGFFILYKNPKSQVNWYFGVFAIGVAGWNLALFLTISGLGQPLLWGRLAFSLASLMPVGLFLFASSFPWLDKRIRLEQLILGGLGVSFFIISSTDLIIKSVRVVDRTYITGELTPFYFTYLIYYFGFLIWSFIKLIQKYGQSQGTKKEQLRYVTIGTIIFFIPLFATQLIFPIFGIFHYNNLGPIFSTVLILAIVYVITRHRFLDIRSLIQRGFLYLLTLAVVTSLYFAVILALERVLRRTVTITPLGSAVIVALFLIFGFPFVRSGLQKITSRLFLRGYYDREQLLSELTRIMAATIDLDRLTESILSKLAEEMHLSKAAFFMVNNHRITDLRTVGYEDHKLIDQALEELFHERFTKHRHFIFEDLEEGPLKELFRRLDIAVAIPIRVESEEVAMLILGPKLSGDIYYGTDIDLLNIFASEAGIAIQNAKAYKEIKKFSQELEKRVIERTKELEEAQQKELAKAQEVARLKDEFVFIAAHELRSPVVAIRGFLELVSAATEKFPKNVQENLRAIATASDHLRQLINDLLEVSRSESETLRVEVASHDFSKILNEVIEEQNPQISRLGLTLKTAVAPLPPVLCDPERLKEVLENLFSNAIKYNREKGSIEVTACKQPQEDVMIFEIRDTGYGIPKDQQERIFQKFFRAGAKETQEVLGTGLGLFITRMLIEKMGGKIAFSSVEHKGTTFTFSLPLVKAV